MLSHLRKSIWHKVERANALWRIIEILGEKGNFEGALKVAAVVDGEHEKNVAFRKIAGYQAKYGYEEDVFHTASIIQDNEERAIAMWMITRGFSPSWKFQDCSPDSGEN